MISVAILKLSATCFFAWLLVFSCIKFYTQPLPPSFEPFHKVYDWLHGTSDTNNPAVVISNPGLVLSPREKLGPNVWGVLAPLSLSVLMTILLIPLPVKKLLDVLVAEWRVVDREREEAAKAIGTSDDAATKMQRHRSAQASLDRAERAIMEFYEDALRSISPSPARRIGLAVFAFLIIMALLLYFLYSTAPSIPGREVAYSTTQSANRVKALEGNRPTRAYMVGAVVVGLLAISASVSVSIWRIKSIARRATESHLTSFRTQFERQLLARMDQTAEIVSTNLSRFASLGQQLAATQSQFAQKLQVMQAEVASAVEHEILQSQELIEELTGTNKNS